MASLLTQEFSWNLAPQNAKPIIFYDNVFALGTPTATDTYSGYSVLNITDKRPYTLWKAASAGTKYITIDCTTAQTVNAVAFTGHNLFTADAIIGVQSSDDNANWTTRQVNFKAHSNAPVMKIFTSASAQYWRVYIVTTSVIPYVGVIFLGEYLEMERWMDAEYDAYTETSNATIAESETGNLLGILTSYVSKSVNARFSYITTGWYRYTFKPVWDAYLKYYYPFFWAWDIENHPDEIDYVRMKIGKAHSAPMDQIRQQLTLTMDGVKE